MSHSHIADNSAGHVLLEAGRDDWETAFLAALTGVAANPFFGHNATAALEHARSLARGATSAIETRRATQADARAQVEHAAAHPDRPIHG